jgi:hypothetical protein
MLRIKIGKAKLLEFLTIDLLQIDFKNKFNFFKNI